MALIRSTFFRIRYLALILFLIVWKICMYGQMTDRLRVIIEGLSFYETANESKVITLNRILDALPRTAMKAFKGEYITAISSFLEFAAYLDMEKEKEYVITVDKKYQDLVNLIIQSQENTRQDYSTLNPIHIRFNRRPQRLYSMFIIDRFLTCFFCHFPPCLATFHHADQNPQSIDKQRKTL